MVRRESEDKIPDIVHTIVLQAVWEYNKRNSSRYSVIDGTITVLRRGNRIRFKITDEDNTKTLLIDNRGKIMNKFNLI